MIEIKIQNDLKFVTLPETEIKIDYGDYIVCDLQTDTIKFTSKEMPKHWEYYHTFSIVDSIMNYPKGKKQELLELAFDENAIMRKGTDSRFSLYQIGSLILKLFEWNIFMIHWNDGSGSSYYELYDYTY